MKLTTKTGVYVSPKPQQGNFTGAYVEDRQITSIRNRNRLEVVFDLVIYKDEQRIVLDSQMLAFFGNEGDAFSSNRTTYFSRPNLNYDATVADSEPEIIEPLMDYLVANNGVYPEEYEIVDYGYPTLEKALEYFTGGTLQEPEVFLTDPLAQGWLLNNLILNGEPVSKQFKFDE